MSRQMQTVECVQFDTFNTISADCDARILSEAAELCGDFDRLLSKTVEGSDVWRINHAQGTTTQVSVHTLRILACAEAVRKASGGAFNVALGRLTALWRFTDGSARIPEADDLAAAVAASDASRIHLAPAPGSAARPAIGEHLLGDTFSPTAGSVIVPPEMNVDLGGIAKGYIADRVADFLRANGVRRALLNFGGNVVTVGSKGDGSQWNMGLQSPWGEHGKDIWATMEVPPDSTAVTSAAYERHFEVDGRRYHHILDPRTGLPCETDVEAVTLVGRDSMLCDALATAAFVMGSEPGYRLVGGFGVGAIVLRRDGTALSSPEIPWSQA